MSHGCCSIAVKHAFFASEPCGRGNPGWEQMVDGIDEWAEMHEDAAYPATWTPPAWYTNQTDAELGYGWVIKKVDSGWEQCVDVKEIYVTVIRKGDKLVYGVNSSQYNNVGEVEMTYFADDESHLQDFLNDFFPGEAYEDNVAVQQWG